MILVLNPNERSWTRHRYILWFGMAGTRYFMVWANSLDSAVDECIDWCADNAPGLLCDEQVNEEYQRLIAEGKTEDEAAEQSVMDTTCGGNNGHFVQSDEWGILVEDPTRNVVKLLIEQFDGAQVAA